MADDDKGNREFEFNTFVKVYAPLIVSILTAVVGGIMWLSNAGASTYYSKDAGDSLADQVKEVKSNIHDIQNQNDEIILMLGNIQGRLEGDFPPLSKSGTLSGQAPIK